MAMKETGFIAAFALAAIGSVGATLAAGSAFHSGDRMPDGTILAGISPATHKPFYTTPADAPSVYRFADAEEYCSALHASGYSDWRPPAKVELNIEFHNRAAIGGFNETGANPTGWYWSSLPPSTTHGWAQQFSSGYQHYLNDDDVSSLRCVRSELRPR